MKISKEVINILNKSTIEGNQLFLPPKLERKLYTDVNKVLEIIGGKWNRKTQSHIFENDIEEIVEELINFGEVIDSKKELQFFPTPKEIIEQMIELADIYGNKVCCLEPSCGNGAILNYLPGNYNNSPTVTYGVEIDARKVEKLKIDFPSTPVKNADFLAVNISDIPQKINRIVMNPPFSRQQDIDHVLHAYDILVKNGILVSVMSESPFFRQNSKSVKFREWLRKVNAEIIDLESGAFKESGTMVKTRIIKIIKKEK